MPTRRHPSPLTYPGGKARILDLLLQHIPPSTEIVISPFIGGGALELTLANRGIQVMAYDKRAHLVDFRKAWLHSPAEIAERVRSYGPPVTREVHLRLRDELRHPIDHSVPRAERAARFYVINHNCWGGLMVRGTDCGPHSNVSSAAISHLQQDVPPRKLRVSCESFELSIPRHPDEFLFCDPPYMGGERVYGDPRASFDHEQLRDVLVSRSGPWLLTYGDHPEVRRLYEGGGRKLLPAAYRGQIRGSNASGRRDLIISSG